VNFSIEITHSFQFVITFDDWNACIVIDRLQDGWNYILICVRTTRLTIR